VSGPVPRLHESAWQPGDVPTQAAILAAAEQTVLAEMARLEALAGSGRLELVIRAENLANRTRKNLGLEAGAPKKRAGSLMDGVKAKYAAPPATGETSA